MTTTRPAQYKAPCATGCNCGCAPPTDECCRLACLERPNFFAGQLLNDTDLTALVTWSRDKQRLARHRHGWGVVCGLAVRADPKQPGRLIVGPGYAIDCCGNDIVLCADSEPYDLAPRCGKGEEPCAEIDLGPVAKEQRRTTRRQELEPTIETITLAGKTYEKVSVVDLLIHYDEREAEQRRAYGGGCRPRIECRPGRVREWHRLSARPAGDSAQVAEKRLHEWKEDFKACLEPLEKLLVTGGSRGQRLLDWLARHPLAQFGFVEEWVRQMSGDKEDELAHALLYVLLDCLGRFIAAKCPSCNAADGVPLARVWLQSADGGRCRVLAIDPSPPHRRPLGMDPLLAPDGKRNLAHLLWIPPDDATRALRVLGMRAMSETIEPPRSIAELREFIIPPLIDAHAEEVVLNSIDAGLYGSRVVAIRPAYRSADTRVHDAATPPTPATPAPGAQTISVVSAADVPAAPGEQKAPEATPLAKDAEPQQWESNLFDGEGI